MSTWLRHVHKSLFALVILSLLLLPGTPAQASKECRQQCQKRAKAQSKACGKDRRNKRKKRIDCTKAHKACLDTIIKTCKPKCQKKTFKNICFLRCRRKIKKECRTKSKKCYQAITKKKDDKKKDDKKKDSKSKKPKKGAMKDKAKGLKDKAKGMKDKAKAMWKAAKACQQKAAKALKSCLKACKKPSRRRKP